MMRQVSAQLPFNKDDVVIQSSALSKTSALRAMNGRKYILLYKLYTYKRDIVGCGGIIKYENQFFRSEAYP